LPTPAKHYYYSTQPFLAWCLSHYFRGGTHYAWVGFPFHPYKRKNPASSNAYLLYANLYHPWYDRDPYDRFVASLRQSLRRAVQAMRLDDDRSRRLKRCCARVEVQLFLPVVYRVDIDIIDLGRLIGGRGSGVFGSDEYLIEDLDEREFDVLFADECADDADLKMLIEGAIDRDQALALIESRCS
jgi:hypothetical protein